MYNIVLKTTWPNYELWPVGLIHLFCAFSLVLLPIVVQTRAPTNPFRPVAYKHTTTRHSKQTKQIRVLAIIFVHACGHNLLPHVLPHVGIVPTVIRAWQNASHACLSAVNNSALVKVSCVVFSVVSRKRLLCSLLYVREYIRELYIYKSVAPPKNGWENGKSM